jgi:hypothetical protein
MPRGPKGEHRPADVIGAAVMVAKLATGELEEQKSPAPKRATGRKIGGKRRAEKLSSEERRRIAKKASDVRWGNKL